MIANLHADESPAARMLDLIARMAPLLMRAGGGGLGREIDFARRQSTAFTRIKRKRAIELGRTGRYTIAEMVGSAQSSVFKALAREGIKTPDGRTVAKRRRAA